MSHSRCDLSRIREWSVSITSPPSHACLRGNTPSSPPESADVKCNPLPDIISHVSLTADNCIRCSNKITVCALGPASIGTMSSGTFSPPVSPPSTASSTSTLRDLELEFQALRDESLSYEDDVEFRIFINVLDLVDAVVVERSPLRGMRRRSFGRLLGGFRKRSEKTSNTEPPMPSS